MKKLIAMLLALVLVMGLVACGTTTPATTTEDTEPPVETGDPTEGTTEDETPVVADPNAATSVLTNIWDAVEGEKFFAMGGDMNNMVDGAPGNYSLEDEGLTASLYVPADQIANLECAGSLMHGMLANNFTAAAYKMAAGADAAAFADAMKAAIDGVQWVCGTPEKIIIAVIGGDTVVVAFGINDAIAPFETAVTTAYADADIKYAEVLVG